MESKKFYWLKLKRDFFKRHDIRIIEGMENGIEISHFYIKLMLESVDHDGELRFSDSIPYTPEMLSTITYTKLDIVNQALSVLESFGLLEQTEDGTFKLPKVTNLIDSASDTDGARRMRRLREEQKANKMCEQTEQSVTDDRTKDDESKSKRQIKSKSKSKSIERKFMPPSIEDVTAYCIERNSPVDPKKFFEYYDAGNWKDSKGNPVKNWKQKLITWERDAEPKAKGSGNEFLDLLGELEGENDQI